jgi:hypothetical protein
MESDSEDLDEMVRRNTVARQQRLAKMGDPILEGAKRRAEERHQKGKDADVPDRHETSKKKNGRG